MDTRTKTPVQILICIRNKKIGKAALASIIKKRAARAESRQCAVVENPPAAIASSNHVLSTCDEYILLTNEFSAFMLSAHNLEKNLQ